MKYNSLVLSLFTNFDQVIRHLYKYILIPHLLLLVVGFFTSFLLCSQLIFEQGIVQGGVTGAGFSTGQGSGSGTFNVHIEPGSTIKKAYLFTYRIGYPPETVFTLNSIPHVFDTTNMLVSSISKCDKST